MAIPATDENVETLTYPAAAGLTSADQFKFLEMNSSGQVALANATTDVVVGVLYSLNGASTTVAGDGVTVAIAGKVKVKAGAAIAAAGVLGSADATGRLITGVATARSVGVIAAAAAAAGEMAELQLNIPGHII